MVTYVVYMLACEFCLFQVQNDPPMNTEVLLKYCAYAGIYEFEHKYK